MSLRIGFGYEQQRPGLYIYDDTTGAVIASEYDEPSPAEVDRLNGAKVIVDKVEYEAWLSAQRYIRWRDKVLVDRYGNEYGKAPGFDDASKM